MKRVLPQGRGRRLGTDAVNDTNEWLTQRASIRTPQGLIWSAAFGPCDVALITAIARVGPCAPVTKPIEVSEARCFVDAFSAGDTLRCALYTYNPQVDNNLQIVPGSDVTFDSGVSNGLIRATLPYTFTLLPENTYFMCAVGGTGVATYSRYTTSHMARTRLPASHTAGITVTTSMPATLFIDTNVNTTSATALPVVTYVSLQGSRVL